MPQQLKSHVYDTPINDSWTLWKSKVSAIASKRVNETQSKIYRTQLSVAYMQ